MFCTNCGQKISENAKFCSKCGGEVSKKIIRTLEDIEKDNGSLRKAKKDVRNAAIAGYTASGLTIIFVILSLSGVNLFNGINSWNLVDVAIGALLAFGVSRYSRFCAITLFIYFIISKIVLFAENTASVSIVSISVSILFLIYFFQGMTGTFTYHRLKEKNVL